MKTIELKISLEKIKSGITDIYVSKYWTINSVFDRTKDMPAVIDMIIDLKSGEILKFASFMYHNGIPVSGFRAD